MALSATVCGPVLAVPVGRCPIPFGVASRTEPALRPTPAAPGVRVVLLGAPHLVVAGETMPFLAPPRTLPLLALLALSRAPLARERVAATLWPDVDEAAARGNLRRHLYALAKALPSAGAPYVTSSGAMLSWNGSSGCEVDAVRFESLLDAQAWDDALALYRGDLLPGHDDEWLIAERERLHERFVSAALSALEAARSKADHRAVLALAQRVLAVDAWREDALRYALAAKYELGDRASALADYEDFAERLERELSVPPAPETAALVEVIRQQRSLAAPAQPARATARTAFRGRDVDLAALAARWNAVRSGAGTTVVVSGDAGIGKSRLVSEFATLVAAQGARALTGGTAPVEARPYQAIVEVLRAAVPTLVAVESAPPWLAPLGVLVPEIAAHRPDLAKPPALDPARERTRLFDAVASAFAALARSRPLLVVLEDLHWARANTLDLVEFLVRRAPALPLLIVVTVRPHESDHALRRLRDLRGNELAVGLALGPLSRDASHEIVCSLDPSAEPRFAELYAQSEGNPLFLAEAVRDLAERPEGAVGAVSIAATIDARLARLEHAPRALLEAAAVCGNGFDLDIVCAACGWSEHDVVERLDVLLDHALVRFATGRDRTRYTFSHDLIRAAAYDGAPADTRRAVHRRVARALARDAPNGDLAALVAEHYDAAGAEREAATCYLRAAQHAASVFAHAEAARLATRGLELERDVEARFALLALAEESARRLGERGRELEASAAMLELADQLGDEARGEALRRRIATLRSLGRRAEAAAYLEALDALDETAAALERARFSVFESSVSDALTTTEHACQLAARGSRTVAFVSAESLHAQALVLAGRVEESDAALDRAVAAARASGDAVLLQETLHGAAVAAFNAMRLDRCEELAAEMQDVARSTGDREGEADAMMRRASSRLRRHDIGGALADFEAAREVYERIGQAYRTSEAFVNLATVYGFAGDWEAALDVSRAAMKQLASLGELRRRSIAAHNVVNCLIELGRYAEAADAIGEALSLARAAESRVLEAYTIGLRGTIAREVGDLVTARRDLEECVAMERAMPTGYERASNLVEMALTLVEAGVLDDASRVLAELEALPAEERATMMWPQFVPYVLYRYLQARGDEQGAARELARASDLLDEQCARLPEETWRRRFNKSLVNRRIRAAAVPRSTEQSSVV